MNKENLNRASEAECSGDPMEGHDLDALAQACSAA